MTKPDEHCISARHEKHGYTPWYWGHPYNKKCDVCGLPAAWPHHRDDVALCDCHAEDWSRWVDIDGTLRATSRKTTWQEVFARFVEEVKSGRFVPDDFMGALLLPSPKRGDDESLTCIDLFCGIGGFHIAADNLDLKVIFATDIDGDACATYQHNFGLIPRGDIVAIPASQIPDHDILMAGFPCQPFSIIGNKLGTADARGTLYKEIIRIARVKRPRGMVLENVKQLATTHHGTVIEKITDGLKDIGYNVDWRILNALDFGLPQKRERVIIVATLNKFDEFPWPTSKKPMTPLSDILEKNPDDKHFVSERIRKKRHEAHTAEISPSIWHENKAGHISSYPYSCALRAGASYNYLLVDGERRLTPREMLRLQGFPETFEIIANDSQARKQAGNAVPVPLIQAALKGVVDVIGKSKIEGRSEATERALSTRSVTE